MSATVTDRLIGVDTQPELERAGRLVRARMEQLGLNREAAVRASALNRETWKRVERGYRVQEVTHTRVEETLQWPAGTMRHIIEGGDPPMDPPTPPPTVQTIDTRHGDLRLLISALGEVDDETQQDMIDAALAAYRASRRSQGPRT